MNWSEWKWTEWIFLLWVELLSLQAGRRLSDNLRESSRKQPGDARSRCFFTS